MKNEKRLEKQVYDFIANNPNTTARLCAKAVNIEELVAIVVINKLRKKGFLTAEILPLGNQVSSDDSHFYSACRPYKDF